MASSKNSHLIRPIIYDRSPRQDHRTVEEAARNTDAVRAAVERGELTEEDETR
jgi:hypothetical protein